MFTVEHPKCIIQILTEEWPCGPLSQGDMTGKVGGKPQPGLHFISLSSRNQKSPNDNDNIYTEDITEQTLKSLIFASRRDFCRTQRQY